MSRRFQKIVHTRFMFGPTCLILNVIAKLNGKSFFRLECSLTFIGDEVWLTLGLSPYPISNVRIKSRENYDGVSSADIAVR